MLPANAEVVIQCPKPGAVCKHLAAGDGFVTMADSTPLYIFGFSDVTGVPAADVMTHANLGANFPAPTLQFNQGDEVFLTLTNVGMIMRPDLFDPHSVHFHGFPNAATVFDGEPEASQGVNMGASFTYYYNLVEPGTFMYHCHVEAAEHMQMGMLGNLYVHPQQDKGPPITYDNGTPADPSDDKTFNTFAYNDVNGSTGYDREFALQLGSFDSFFHEQHIAVQPLPFAGMKDNYAMINGRGYPDTVIDAPMSTMTDFGPKVSQPVNSLVTARAGDRVLLRLSNLSVTNFYTVTVLGLPMKIVGQGARILRAHAPDNTEVPGGKELYYKTASVTLGGGEAYDALIDIPAGTPVGTTYFLYTTNLNYLSNGPEDFGGMMTEIRVIN